MTFAAKVITKEIRKAEKVEVNENTLIVNGSGTTQSIFKQQGDTILKDQSPFVTGIAKFEVYYDDINNRILKMKIESIDQKGKKESIETEIYIREGVIIEPNAQK